MFAFLNRLKDRLKKLFDDYGYVALSVYWIIFLSTLAIFYVSLERGVDVGALIERMGMDWGETAEKTGTVAVAYAATKILQPLRILLTLALVPPVGTWWKKRKTPQAEPSVAPAKPEQTETPQD
jgi:hypothetical protein